MYQSWLQVIKVEAFISRISLRLALWFVFIIWYLWFMLTLSSIWNQCSDVGNGIWSPQNCMFMLLWCDVEVAQLGGLVIVIYFFLFSFVLLITVYLPGLCCVDNELTQPVELWMSQSSHVSHLCHLFLGYGLQWPLSLVCHLNSYFNIYSHAIKVQNYLKSPRFPPLPFSTFVCLAWDPCQQISE